MQVKKAKKGIFHIIFSRTALIVVLLLIQIGIFIGTISMLEEYATSVYIGLIILSMMVIVYIINRKENPAFKMSWILFVLLIPIVGTAFYIFMLIQPGTSYIRKRLFVLRDETSPYMKQDRKLIEELRISKPANANLAHYMSKICDFPVHGNTKVTYFPLGEDKFVELKIQLENAKKFIFMEYFIVETGAMWNAILDLSLIHISEPTRP